MYNLLNPPNSPGIDKFISKRRLGLTALRLKEGDRTRWDVSYSGKRFRVAEVTYPDCLNLA